MIHFDKGTFIAEVSSDFFGSTYCAHQPPTSLYLVTQWHPELPFTGMRVIPSVCFIILLLNKYILNEQMKPHNLLYQFFPPVVWVFCSTSWRRLQRQVVLDHLSQLSAHSSPMAYHVPLAPGPLHITFIPGTLFCHFYLETPTGISCIHPSVSLPQKPALNFQ